MDQNCELFFPLPEQKKADRDEIKLVLGIFQKSLSDLPFGNQEKAAKEIFDLLYKSNKIQFKDDERVALLKEIEKVAPNVINGLREKIKNVTVPVGRREEKVAKLLVGLHYELALAYRCLLTKQPAMGLLRKTSKVAEADCIRLIIYHLGEILRTKYTVFSNPRGTIWKYTYTLFICANNLDIHNINLPSSGWCKFNTVEEAFKSILLMSLSSPLTMRGNEFNSLYELAPELTQYIELGKINCGDEYPDLMTFNLSGTESPKKQFATGCDSCSNASNCFTVSTTTLLEHLEKQRWQIKTGKQLTPLQKLLSKDNQFHRLKRNLSGSESVDHTKRIKGGGIVELVVGFSDICTFLGKEKKDASVSTNEDGIVEDMENWTTLGEESITVEDTVDWTTTGIIKAGLRKTICKVINHSSGGYCLYIDAKERFHLRVGELAMVKETGKNDWHMVVIIWVSGNRKRMDFGVKLLDGTVSSGTAKRVDDKSADSALDCLFLKIEYGDDDSSIRIITATSSFSKGDRLLVHYKMSDYRVTVTGINSTTDGYVEYSCDWNDIDDDAATTAFEMTTAEADFESVWDEL